MHHDIKTTDEKMKPKNQNKIVALSFFTLTLLFIVVSMTNQDFFNWVFERHHNQWSWYLRPIFLIPFCYFAYKHNWAGISITIFLLFTSMFWFSKPEFVNMNVTTFLQFEKEWLYGEWDLKKTMLVFTIPISFFFLGLSFWNRNFLSGLVVVVLIAFGKIIWSLHNAGESGKSILFPAVSGLILYIILLFFGFKRKFERLK